MRLLFQLNAQKLKPTVKKGHSPTNHSLVGVFAGLKINIVYRPGSQLASVDYLSRNPID